MISEKPLFLPLRTEHYERFESGEKENEYRAYGKRWNEKTCRIGRDAIVSKGYGKQNRLYRKVVSFRKIPWNEAPPAAKEIYPNEPFIAEIGLPDLTKLEQSHD